MNERIEKLRKRIKDTPIEKEVDIFLKKVQEDVKNDFSTKMVSEVTQVIVEVKELLGRRDQGFRDLTAYLQFQKEELERTGEAHKGVLYDVIESLDQLTKSLHATQKVSVTNPVSMKLTRAEMKVAFMDALETVEKLLLSQNEEPDRSEYERINGRITKITDFYKNFEVVTILTYDREGRLKSTTTEKR